MESWSTVYLGTMKSKEFLEELNARSIRPKQDHLTGISAALEPGISAILQRFIPERRPEKTARQRDRQLIFGIGKRPFGRSSMVGLVPVQLLVTDTV